MKNILITNIGCALHIPCINILEQLWSLYTTKVQAGWANPFLLFIRNIDKGEFMLCFSLSLLTYVMFQTAILFLLLPLDFSPEANIFISVLFFHCLVIICRLISTNSHQICLSLISLASSFHSGFQLRSFIPSEQITSVLHLPAALTDWSDCFTVCCPALRWWIHCSRIHEKGVTIEYLYGTLNVLLIYKASNYPGNNFIAKLPIILHLLCN